MWKIMGFAIGLTILVAVTVRTTVRLLEAEPAEGISATTPSTRAAASSATPSARLRPVAPLCDHPETPEEAQTQLQVSLHSRAAASIPN